MGRGGGVSSRGRGKFKVSRGGGRHFSREVDPRLNRDAEGSEDESEDESDEDDDDDDGVEVEHKLAPEMAALNLKLGNTVEIVDEGPEISRAERKAMKKAQAKAAEAKGKAKVEDDDDDDESEEDDDDDELLNPFGAKAQAKNASAAKSGAGRASKPAPPPQLTRKEQEAADKKAAAERYAKLHAQGKTAEAKTDLARLQEVRRKREAAAAAREAEAAEAAAEAAAKKERQVRR